MIEGVINARRLAVIPLIVRHGSGQQKEVEAIVDTGFTGSLTLPPDLIAGFGLPWRSRGSAILANGARDYFDIHAATVIWNGVPRNVLVEAAATEPLVGMRLLFGHELRMRVVENGDVTIQKV